MVFTALPNSVLLCNPFQSDLPSLREVVLLKSPVTIVLPWDVSILISFNCPETFGKCPLTLSLNPNPHTLSFSSSFVVFLTSCAILGGLFLLLIFKYGNTLKLGPLSHTILFPHMYLVFPIFPFRFPLHPLPFCSVLFPIDDISGCFCPLAYDWVWLP